MTGRCICGATAQLSVILEDGSLQPVTEPQPRQAHYMRFDHEADCPATSPALLRAVEAGEIDDPGSDLFDALRRSG